MSKKSTVDAQQHYLDAVQNTNLAKQEHKATAKARDAAYIKYTTLNVELERLANVTRDAEARERTARTAFTECAI